MLEHPFAPEACWRFALSRPFRVPRVDQLLNDVVRPVLEKRGLILECSNASDDPESHTFWMNRMKIMLELADFHVFLQLRDTAQIEFERDYSKNVTRIGKAPALDTNFELKRRKSRFFAPTVISIRDGWGLDRFSAWRGTSVIHCGGSSASDDFGRRFARIVDRCIQARVRRIQRWYRMEERSKRFAERLKPKIIDLVMRILSNRAKRDPRIFANVGSPETARKMVEEMMFKPRRRNYRLPRLEVRNTLVRESELARIIARDPNALDAYTNWKPSDPGKVAAENEIEVYLHKIRQGTAQFSQRFSETYQQEVETFHANVDNKLEELRRKASRKKVASGELQEGLDEIKKLTSKLDGVAGVLGAWSFRRRVRQAKGKFHNDSKRAGGPH
jgi:hypothetical protein